MSTEHGETAGGEAGAPPLLEVSGLTVEFSSRRGPLAVVQDLDLTIETGQVHAVVGESGSGKSVTALAIIGLLPERTARIASGRIRLRGRDLTRLTRRELRAVQGRELAMVFQEPMSSLNPAFTVGDQIAESMRFHLHVSRAAARRRSAELLAEVGIPQAAKRLDSYPHEFSGGMRQRAMIAIALACEPQLLIADEPTTALDVTIQAQIVELLHRLCRDHQTSIMFITHDFGIVAEIADVVTVMYAAEVIESADVFGIFDRPAHPYTEALLHAVPSLDSDLDTEDGAVAGSAEQRLRGAPPAPGMFPAGCRFSPRCAYARDECGHAPVGMQPGAGGRVVRCIRAAELILTGRA